MALQYIGARYVPKFYEGTNGAAWESGVPYEPLTIVTYLGNSWTSKKPVPANIGAPNLNGDYWVLTGNYNAQIEEYIEVLSGLQDDINAIQLELGGAEDDIKVLQDTGKAESATPSQAILANYQGDIVDVDTQVTAVCMYNDIVYVVRSYADNVGRALLSNAGVINTYDFATKHLIDTHAVTVGHGNSICFNPDDGMLYVVPIWDYSQSGRPAVNYIYKINPQTWVETSVSTTIDGVDKTVFGVSYDHVKGKMYAMAWGLELLEYENGAFKSVCEFSTPFETGEDLQDFAVKDGVFTLTSARNSLVNYLLSEGQLNVISKANICDTDSQYIFQLGEVEGMEYDEDGHLICSFLKYVASAAKSASGGVPARQMTCGFITELVTGSGPKPYKKPLAFRNAALSLTYNLIPSNTDLVLPNGYSVRQIQQREAFITPIPRVQMQEDLEGTGIANYIDITSPLVLDMNSKKISNTHGFRLYADLKIVGTGTLDVNGASAGAIYCLRGGLWLTTSANLTVKISASGQNNFVNPGGEPSLIWDGANVTQEGEGGDLYIYNAVRERYKFHVGSLIFSADS